MSFAPTRHQIFWLVVVWCTVLLLLALYFAPQAFHRPVSKRVMNQGTVHLSQLADDWDMVCVATPYCYEVPEAPAAMEQVCDEMNGDTDYGLGFFQDGRLIHAEYFIPFPKAVKSSRSCFTRDEDPVILQEGNNFVVKASADQP